MIKIILDYLPYLFLAISTNIVLGTYNSVFKLHETFNKKKLLEGIYKAFVISFGFISTAIIYDKLFGVVEVGTLEIQPDILLISAIVLYFTKSIINLKDILKVVELVYPTPVEYDFEEDNDFYLDNTDLDEYLDSDIEIQR
jgi:hypothetical protein